MLPITKECLHHLMLWFPLLPSNVLPCFSAHLSRLFFTLANYYSKSGIISKGSSVAGLVPSWWRYWEVMESLAGGA
jgi:hypothetical protein